MPLRASLKAIVESLARQPDRLSGGILAVIAALAMHEAWHLPFGSVRAPDAGFFPLSISVLLFLFACGIILSSRARTSAGWEFGARSWYVVFAALAFVLYAILIGKLGFVIATTAILLLLMRGFGGVSWTRSLIIAVPSVLLTYVAFVQLGVPLPSGPLPF